MTPRAAILLSALVALSVFLVVERGACQGRPKGPAPTSAGRAPFRIEVVARAVEPVHLLAAPGDARRIFVVEKGGRVRILRDGQLEREPFVDISSRVSRGSEQGLLSIAFHPRYAENGRVFLSYTDRDGTSRLVERRVARGRPDRAPAEGEREILSQKQPWANHNGGLILFGPDGKLWIGFGDGGSRADPLDSGQRLDTWLGKLLRIDVDAESSDGRGYAIPPDNPFAGRGDARPEIWAYGLRNPWRFAFDRDTRALYIADVGQDLWEEVDVEGPEPDGGLPARGANFGWNIMEGFHPFKPAGRSTKGLELPAIEYGRAGGCSITGGIVYRGTAIPAIRGAYFYADYCTGKIWSFRWTKGEVEDATEWTAAVNPEGFSRFTSFGEDAAGEMYLLSQDGEIYKFVPAS